MKHPLRQTLHIIRYHWTTLLLFEMLYRLFGLAIIFPLVNQLFYWSIRLTGDNFIINRDVVDYVFRPSTILIGIVIALIFGLYVTFEVITLAILFHQSRFERPITLQVLLITSAKQTYHIIKTYHITILISAMIFLTIVEGLHVVGVASTIQLPLAVTEELQGSSWFLPAIVVFAVVLTFLFFETMFYELHCTVTRGSIQTNMKSSHRFIQGNHLAILGEFAVINGLLNLLFYGLYLVVIVIVGISISLFRNGTVAFAIVLSILYSLYLVIGFLASIVLIPMNFAWINVRFYQHDTEPRPFMIAILTKVREQKRLKRPTFQRLFVGVNLALILAITLWFSIGNQVAVSNIAFLQNPTIISHRGGGYYAPENTLASIEEGIALGADAIEIDVRFTSDGVPVLMHDLRTGRTTNDILDRRVRDMTLAELQTLDAGSWFDPLYFNEPVPTLEAVLAAVDGRVELYIEVKARTTDTAQVINDLIETYNMERRVKILSFDPTLLQEFKDQNSRLKTVFLMRQYVGDINVLLTMDHVDYFAVNEALALDKPENIHLLQQNGKGIFVWTVNDVSSITELNRLGVSGLITDEPLITREVVYGDTTRSLYTDLLKLLFKRNS